MEVKKPVKQITFTIYCPSCGNLMDINKLLEKYKFFDSSDGYYFDNKCDDCGKVVRFLIEDHSFIK